MGPAQSVASPLATLLERADIRRGGALGLVARPSVPTGFAALDAVLPGGGWPAGALTELLPRHEGIGELRILGHALACRAAQGHGLAWIAPPYLPYAPALAATGIDLARLLIVKTRSLQETLWAIEQSLRSNACGAVLAWLSRVKYPELRRLQLAAAGSHAMAMLFRPATAAHESSPAVLRLALDTADGGLAVHVLKRRGIVLDRPVVLPAALAPGNPADTHVVDRPLPPEPAGRDPHARFALA